MPIFDRLSPRDGARRPGFDLSKPFSLSAPVGLQGPNKRDDVAKVESHLGRAGYMDLKPTNGPTGYPGQRLVQGIKRYQKDKGLKVDGYLNPTGSTLTSLRADAGGGYRTTFQPSNAPTGYRTAGRKPDTPPVAGPTPRNGERPSPAPHPRRDGHDFDGVSFDGKAGSGSIRVDGHEFDGVPFDGEPGYHRHADEFGGLGRKDGHDFDGVPFDGKPGYKPPARQETMGEGQGRLRNLLDRLYDGIDEFMKDPSNGPTETPPTDPPMGPPPPSGQPKPKSPRLPRGGRAGRAAAILYLLRLLNEKGR